MEGLSPSLFSKSPLEVLWKDIQQGEAGRFTDVLILTQNCLLGLGPKHFPQDMAPGYESFYNMHLHFAHPKTKHTQAKKIYISFLFMPSEQRSAKR